MVDSTGDGVADSIGYDTTGDGIVDALDITGDGKVDTAIVVKPSSSAHAHLPLDDYLNDEEESAWAAAYADQVYTLIDADGDGQVSKLELLAAMVRNKTVNDFVLPCVDSSHALTDERSFDAVSATFDLISSGKKRISRKEFIQHFQKESTRSKSSKYDEKEAQLHSVFQLIDADGKGSFSNFELLAALQRSPEVANFLLPGVERHRILRDEKAFDAVSAIWDDMARGRRHVTFVDFAAHVRTPKSQQTSQPNTLPLAKSLQKKWRQQDADEESEEEHAKLPLVGNDPSKPTLLQSLRSQKQKLPAKAAKRHHDEPRHLKYILIISPGFGRELNPAQGAMVQQAGFQVQYVDVPNPEEYGFSMQRYLSCVLHALEQFRPHLLVSASKGNAYVLAIWERHLWKGPVLMLNVPPQLTHLPKDTTVVLAQGSNDELYSWNRVDLEKLVATGSDNRCFLYYTSNSGHFTGGFTRVGDSHNMASLLQYDCLPRLIDAALCESGPEMHILASWRNRLSFERNEAEKWLSHCPEQLRNLWVSKDHLGMDSKKLYEVPRRTDEFKKVETIFKADPAEPAAYLGMGDTSWRRTTILRVERVENGLLEHSENVYYECLQRSIEDQGLTFEPGVHTRWAFHGTDQVESIVEDPMTGFQPLACGTRLGSLWGSGTYFARDAHYVVDGNFCPPRKDGSRQMLLCLLMIGMPCLGDQQHHGVLPLRRKPHRYNSSVDSLSSPEIFITQHPGAAYPAYLITFV
jgi:Ca2+-binding EF-hand superfamily protein